MNNLTDELSAARYALEEAERALRQAEANVASARQANDAAQRAINNPNANDDAETLMAAADAAAEQLRRQTVKLGVVTKQRDAARTELRAATGRASQPAHDGAVRDMLASCRRADEARAMLATAETEFRAAVAAFEAAVGDGAQPAFRGRGVDTGSPSLTGPDAVWKQPTEAEMRKRVGMPAA